MIVWNVDPEIFSIGSREIRYYGLLFALGFYLGYKIFQRIVKKEKLEESLLDKLLMYVMIGTVVGARLGHCLFYEPAYYLSNPIAILKVYEGGLASHGGAIGILIAIYFFSKKVSKRSMLWSLDRLLITVALAGALIRSGNLMNSEIYGEPTNSEYGFVYAQDTRLSRTLKANFSQLKSIESVKYVSEQGESPDGGRSWPLDVVVTFKRHIQQENDALSILNYQLKPWLALSEKEDGSISNIYANPDDGVEVKIDKGRMVGVIKAWGIPKHPTHIYEALVYLLGFLVLMWMYWKKDAANREGLLTGVFLEFVFLSRFLIEFIKENQVGFESGMQLNMGQWLSIPFILGGVFLIVRASRKTPKAL